MGIAEFKISCGISVTFDWTAARPAESNKVKVLRTTIQQNECIPLVTNQAGTV